MRWGRRSDANLRSRVQVLESRQRLAVANRVIILFTPVEI
jgi:hypothetical protein